MEIERSLPKYVTRWRDRHGKERWRFRKDGRAYYFKARPGTAAFEREYQTLTEASGSDVAALRLSRMAPRKNGTKARAPEGVVYFIGGDRGPVKIGMSSDPVKRLAALQTGHPLTLKLLATIVGGRELEAYFHAKFAVHRIGGEWFKREPLLEAEIALLRGLKKTGWKITQI